MGQNYGGPGILQAITSTLQHVLIDLGMKIGKSAGKF
jgi:hypothetical protein